MAVERENIETLQEWLADESPVRAASKTASTVVEKLAALAFNGDADWPNSPDNADGYRDALQGLFAHDSGAESRFVALTSAAADPGIFLEWFLPVLHGWERRDPRNGDGAPDGSAPGGVASDPAAGRGFANPSFDGTPGTEFYRADGATGTYLYSASEQGGDWAEYDQRRYSEPTRDDGYQLNCRYDRRDRAYEWYDESGGAWRDQAWADAYLSSRTVASAAASGGSAAQWDESWRMFYRVGADGVYEFADAVTPGDQASGCGEVWLTTEQLLARNGGGAAADSGEGAEQSVQAAARAAVEAALESAPELKGALSAAEIADVIASLAQEIGDQA